MDIHAKNTEVNKLQGHTGRSYTEESGRHGQGNCYLKEAHLLTYEKAYCILHQIIFRIL